MKHSLNPNLKALLGFLNMDRKWVRGEGVWLTDQGGRRFLDFYAQYGAVALGHNPPAVVAALQQLLQEQAPAMVQPYRGPNAEALALELTRVAPGMDRCVFTNSGAETVEAAIKLVRSTTGRSLILTSEGSFHGKTMGALAATGQPQYKEGFGPPPPGFERVPFGDAEALERRLEQDAGRVAGVLLEPIAGERGVFPSPPGYLRAARELCTRHGVPLILDEIQTGLGRTGRLFACEHAGVVPDLLLVAKALGGGLFPLGAVLASERFWNERFAIRHSSTFANNNVACGVGLAALRVLAGEGFAERVAHKGEVLMSRARALAARFPSVIADVRGQGLLTALELRPFDLDKSNFLAFIQHQGLFAYAVASILAEREGVLTLPVLGASNVLRLCPPLVVEEAEIHRAFDGLESVCGLIDRGEVYELARSMGALRPPASRARAAAREEPPIRMPLPPPEPPSRSTFAFLVHYTRPEDIVTGDPELARATAEELEGFSEFMARIPPGVIVQVPCVRSATGATADGFVIGIGMLPEHMVRFGRKRVSGEICRAVDLAHALGASVVGLGGFTTPYSRRGVDVLGRGPAITTGNVLTAGMAVEAIRHVRERRDLSMADATVAVVGARGSVGALAAQLLARHQPRRLWLVGNPTSGTDQLDRLRELLRMPADRIESTTSLDALARCDVVLSATGAARPVLDAAPLAAGTIVCDVARPPDSSRVVRDRTDLTVIDGGLVALPDPTLRFGMGNLQGFPDGIQLACLSETILLALCGEGRDHGIGDEVSIDEVDQIMALAAQHGFKLAPPPLDALDSPASRGGRSAA